MKNKFNAKKREDSVYSIVVGHVLEDNIDFEIRDSEGIPSVRSFLQKEFGDWCIRKKHIETPFGQILLYYKGFFDHDDNRLLAFSTKDEDDTVFLLADAFAFVFEEKNGDRLSIPSYNFKKVITSFGSLLDEGERLVAKKKKLPILLSEEYWRKDFVGDSDFDYDFSGVLAAIASRKAEIIQIMNRCFFGASIRFNNEVVDECTRDLHPFWERAREKFSKEDVIQAVKKVYSFSKDAVTIFLHAFGVACGMKKFTIGDLNFGQIYEALKANEKGQRILPFVEDFDEIWDGSLKLAYFMAYYDDKRLEGKDLLLGTFQIENAEDIKLVNETTIKCLNDIASLKNIVEKFRLES